VTLSTNGVTKEIMDMHNVVSIYLLYMGLLEKTQQDGGRAEEEEEEVLL
jgi:hypothetical protein